jgi:hypothetical protein
MIWPSTFCKRVLTNIFSNIEGKTWCLEGPLYDGMNNIVYEAMESVF